MRTLVYSFFTTNIFCEINLTLKSICDGVVEGSTNGAEQLQLKLKINKIKDTLS